MSALVPSSGPSTVAAPLPTATDSLVRCDHIGCPYPATKQVIQTQHAGQQTLRFCAPHAGVWAQRVMAKRGQTLMISDYPCPPAESGR